MLREGEMPLGWPDQATEARTHHLYLLTTPHPPGPKLDVLDALPCWKAKERRELLNLNTRGYEVREKKINRSCLTWEREPKRRRVQLESWFCRLLAE